MAQLINVKLSRFDATPWGFRLQGGKDFGQPLLIQKVNGGSAAEKAGLQVGDAVIRVNGIEVYSLRHKEAQDTIVRAGNNFELSVQRGGSTWKPQITPVGANVVKPQPIPQDIQPVTKTSLAANKRETAPIGSAHNFTAKPFGGAPPQVQPQVNGTIGDPTVKAIVNKQYNTPVGMYSEETIAETLSAQAEVLAGGVLGVNFKKNEKTYSSEKSEVFKLVQEIDKEPREPEPVEAPSSGVGQVAGLRHVLAPETKPAPPEDSSKTLPPGQNICAECERLIVGVFVRIKDKNLHVECFKCATCGTSLKNVGYYNINNKLYCDIHAKLVARQQAPPNYEPMTLSPGSRAPAGTISAALSAAAAQSGPMSPQPGTLAPMPFHSNSPEQTENNYPLEKSSSSSTSSSEIDTDVEKFKPAAIKTKNDEAPRTGTTHVPAPRSFQAPSATAPRPFSVASPASTLSRPAPGRFTPQAQKPTSTKKGGSRFVWPPPKPDDEELTGPTATPLYVAPGASPPAQASPVAFSPYSPPQFSPAPPAPSTQTFSPAPARAPAPPSIPSPARAPAPLPVLAPAPPAPAPLPAPPAPAPISLPPAPAPISLPPAPAPSASVPPAGPAPPAGGAPKGATFAGAVAPRRGKGVLNPQVAPGARGVPVCGMCSTQIRGPFITALGKTWCPDHFICVNGQCRRQLQDIGFVEEKGDLYCEYCFEQFLAPTCDKCRKKIKEDCLNAIGKHFHPECFACAYCGKLFGNNPFFLEDGLPYCEGDWNELFTTKCFACGFPIEAGDRWVEALNNNYHSQCFNCTMCKKNLEGQSFYAKGGRPFCKSHAR